MTLASRIKRLEMQCVMAGVQKKRWHVCNESDRGGSDSCDGCPLSEEEREEVQCIKIVYGD